MCTLPDDWCITVARATRTVCCSCLTTTVAAALSVAEQLPRAACYTEKKCGCCGCGGCGGRCGGCGCCGGCCGCLGHDLMCVNVLSTPAGSTKPGGVGLCMPQLVLTELHSCPAQFVHCQLCVHLCIGLVEYSNCGSLLLRM